MSPVYFVNHVVGSYRQPMGRGAGGEVETVVPVVTRPRLLGTAAIRYSGFAINQ